MIETLNPDLTPFDNPVSDFQAGEDSPAIPFAIRNTGPDQLLVTIEHPIGGSSDWAKAHLL